MSLVPFIFAFAVLIASRRFLPLITNIVGSVGQTELSLNILLVPHVVVAVLPQNVLDTRHRVIHYLGNQENVICLFSLSSGDGGDGGGGSTRSTRICYVYARVSKHRQYAERRVEKPRVKIVERGTRSVMRPDSDERWPCARVVSRFGRYSSRRLMPRRDIRSRWYEKGRRKNRRHAS